MNGTEMLAAFIGIYMGLVSTIALSSLVTLKKFRF